MQKKKKIFVIRNYYQIITAIIANQPVTLLHNFQTSFSMCSSEISSKTGSYDILDEQNNKRVLHFYISHLLSHKMANYFRKLN